MLDTKSQKIRIASFLILIGSLCLDGCFLQPVERVERVYNFVDYDAPAVRLAHPIEAELLAKDPETGEWKSIGRGTIPAGAYIKGRAPKSKRKNEGVNP